METFKEWKEHTRSLNDRKDSRPKWGLSCSESDLPWQSESRRRRDDNSKYAHDALSSIKKQQQKLTNCLIHKELCKMCSRSVLQTNPVWQQILFTSVTLRYLKTMLLTRRVNVRTATRQNIPRVVASRGDGSVASIERGFRESRLGGSKEYTLVISWHHGKHSWMSSTCRAAEE